MESANEVTTPHAFVTDFLAQHEGVRLYSLSTSSAETTHSWLASHGFVMDSITSYTGPTFAPSQSAWDDGPNIFSVEFDSINPPAHLPHFRQLAAFPYDRTYYWTLRFIS